MEKFVTLKELARELQMDRSHLRRYVIAQGLSPIKVRTTESRGQQTLALSLEEAEFIRQQRASEGFLPESRIVNGGTGYFYIIQLIPEFSPKRVKLGFAANVATRLQTHRTSAPTATLVKAWPCKRTWEQAAIDSITRIDSKQIANEVFDCDDISGLVKRAEEFFSLMPVLSSKDAEKR